MTERGILAFSGGLDTSVVVKYLQEDLAKNLKGQGFNEAMVAEYFDRWKGDIYTKANIIKNE